MEVTDSEMMTSQGKVVETNQPPLESERQQQPNKNQQKAFPSSLGRQSSIYSLTLDEFQHTLCENGKNFGSMNMDDFLNSIWTAEENQAHAQSQSQSQSANVNIPNPNHDHNNKNVNPHFFQGEASAALSTAKQPCSQLPRQGSLTLPPPLCRKTVDEVWSEIHKAPLEQLQSGGGGNNTVNVQNPGSTQRQRTFGEMTLEDFLIRAGVVREQVYLPPPSQQQVYGLYKSSNNPGLGPPGGFISRPVIGLASGGGGGGAAAAASCVNIPAGTYQPHTQGGVGGVGEPSGYPTPSPETVCYGGRVGNAGGGYGQVQGMGMGMGSPVSPVSSDGIGGNQVDGMGMGMEGMKSGGRKRIVDGPVEVVVERRQRRMIKNRESAARSRARKQAYTVELEAELNQLKEENAQLRQALAELERKRKQQIWSSLTALFHEEHFEEVQRKALTKSQRAKDKLRVMRRSLSCPT